MKYRLAILFILLLSASISFAQTDKEERREQQEEKKTAAKDKVDYNLFRRQIMGLKEFSEERRKIPALQKANKVPVKILAVVDSLSDNEDPKKLTGYIQQNIGDNSINVYEVTFDRTVKKITTVKSTGEAAAAEEEKDETATEKKSSAKHAGQKKKKGDDDDEEEEEKPSKKKQKEEDD